MTSPFASNAPLKPVCADHAPAPVTFTLEPSQTSGAFTCSSLTACTALKFPRALAVIALLLSATVQFSPSNLPVTRVSGAIKPTFAASS